jgi:CheY-like chemotaxis protein
MDRRGYKVVILEHDDDDRFIASSVMSEFRPDLTIHFVADPEALFDYLQKNRPYPDLLILDLVLPSGNGIDVLRKIKTSEAYKHIPTLAISGSVHEEVIMECYKAGANSVFSKPYTDKGTTSKISTVMNYWFSMAELPGRPVRASEVLPME